MTVQKTRIVQRKTSVSHRSAGLFRDTALHAGHSALTCYYR